MEVGILVALSVVFGGIMEPAGVLHGDLVALLWCSLTPLPSRMICFSTPILLKRGCFCRNWCLIEDWDESGSWEPKGGGGDFMDGRLACNILVLKSSPSVFTRTQEQPIYPCVASSRSVAVTTRPGDGRMTA